MKYLQKNILISLEGRYADSILSGSKKVELRNRRMNLSKGDRIWIYSKQPRGCIVMVTIVEYIAEDSPDALWNEYHKLSGVTKQEFFTYFDSVEIGYAISLGEINRLSDPVSLKVIRKTDRNFHPPQFSKYLMAGTPLLTLLESRLMVMQSLNKSG